MSPPAPEGGHQFTQSSFDNAEAASPGAYHASQASSRPNPDYVPFLERLANLPQIREIPWRPGQALPPEKAEDSPRVQQRGACLLSTRGKVMELKCEHCARGYGRFSLCVTLEPWFQGACSSCIFTSKGNKCSLRFQTSGTADGRALRYHAADDTSGPQSYIRNVSDIPPQITKKRKRRSAPASSLPSHDASYAKKQQLESPDPDPASPDLDTLLQAEIAREQASGPPEYVMPVVERQAPRASVKLHTAPSGSSSAWTPANQQPLDNQGAMPNVSKSRDAAPAAVARWAAIKEPPVPTSGASNPPDHGSSQGVPGAALIDTFSKAKQRHIYGVIGGLESGIDHLNAQVVSLKALLGIDVEESKPR